MAENTRSYWSRICGIFFVALCIFTIVNHAFAGTAICIGNYEDDEMDCPGGGGTYGNNGNVYCDCGSGYTGTKVYVCDVDNGWEFVRQDCVCNTCDITTKTLTDFAIAGGRRKDIQTTKTCRSGCECDSSCKGTTTAVSCKCDSGYVVVGTGNNCTCEKSVSSGVCTPQYCDEDYYVDSIQNKCENCPYWDQGIDQDNAYAYSSSYNIQGVKECYVVAGSKGEDDSGFFTLTGDCYHD